MDMPEVVRFLRNYAERIAAPVETGTEVTAVRVEDDVYSLSTKRGPWRCRTLVVASGACNVPTVPALAEALPAGISSITPMQYRNPSQLEDGGVMVVGASGGDSLYIVGKLLGHKQSRTTERYAHLADDPLRASANRIAQRVAAALNRRSGADVIDLPKKGA